MGLENAPLKEPELLLRLKLLKELANGFNREPVINSPFKICEILIGFNCGESMYAAYFQSLELLLLN